VRGREGEGKWAWLSLGTLNWAVYEGREGRRTMRETWVEASEYFFFSTLAPSTDSTTVQ